MLQFRQASPSRQNHNVHDTKRDSLVSETWDTDIPPGVRARRQKRPNTCSNSTAAQVPPHLRIRARNPKCFDLRRPKRAHIADLTKKINRASLEGVGAASGDLLAGGALPDASHHALGRVLAAEGARVLGVLGDLHGRESGSSGVGTSSGGCEAKG